MTSVRIWLVILGLTAVTVMTRSGFLVLPAGWKIPQAVQRALRYAPACALAAIVVPEIFLPSGHFSPVLANPRIPAAIVAALISALTKSMLFTILAGMLVLTAFRLL